MKTTTVSSRLTDAELQCLDEIAERSGLDRSAMIKRIIRRGIAEIRIESAIEMYRRDEATLSRAAELAELTIWDLLGRLDREEAAIHYDERDFHEDLSALKTTTQV